jgi:glycosyltransferase involved in cell wall biosynthesis
VELNKLTVTVITYNEEGNIRDCLESVKWADEIVVVDSGSSDKTVAIAREYTDNVFINPWPGHKEQKNFAIDKASNLWIFSIDADERAADSVRKFVVNALGEPGAEGYCFPRQNYFLGKWIRYCGWYPDHVLRLFRKDKGRFGGTNPHDKVIIESGSVATATVPIVHITYESISQYVAKQNFYSDISALEMFKAGRDKHIDLIIFPKMLWKFVEVFFLKRGILDGFRGFIISAGTSYYLFLKYAKLWALTVSNKGGNQ